MQIRHVLIKNFRGIKQLEWTIFSPIMCLIGAGDSTKSTVLDAIEYALSPRWNLTFEDCDFHAGNTDNPIEIIVTVGQISDELFKQEKFGLLMRGWSPQHEIHDEPQDGDEHVLSIKLKVEKSLEPEWGVVCDRDTEGRSISSKDREKLGMNRLGTFIDKHLYWGQGSALSSLTTDGRENAAPVIVDAHRQAREAAKVEDIGVFKSTADRAEKIAEVLGYKPKNNLRPALDPRSINIGLGAIAIHDGNIPLRLSGLGSRKLFALGIQLACVEDGALLLIDEIENGLEPHRIRHLLNHLEKAVNKDTGQAGQVIMTSHSYTVIVELPVTYVYVARSIEGVTIIKKVPKELQPTVRAVPDSLLGNKVIVCEGKTEVGFIRALSNYWIEQKSRSPISYYGVVVVDGVGTSSPNRASELADLGYATCLFIDGDKLNELQPDVNSLNAKGIKVLHWNRQKAIEQAIASDISWDALKNLIGLGITEKGDESVFDAVWSRVGNPGRKMSNNIDEWLASGIPEESIRNAIGESAKVKEWFKRIDLGEELGKIVVADLPNLSGKETLSIIEGIEGWIYG